MQKILDLIEGHIQRTEISNGVERLKLACAEIAVACFGVHVFRGDETESLIMTDTADAQMKKPRHFSYGKKLRVHVLHILCVIPGLTPEPGI